MRIDLSNFMIDNLTLDDVPHMPKDYLNRWVFNAKAHPGKLIIGEREIPIKYISIRAEIEQKYVDENIIQEIFPTPEERAQLVRGSTPTANTAKGDAEFREDSGSVRRSLDDPPAKDVRGSAQQ